MSAQIEFGTFEPEVTENPYHEIISQLVEAGETAAVTLTVEAEHEKRERNYFSKAANAQDKTARLRVRDDEAVEYEENAKGNLVPVAGFVKLTFTLTKRHAPRRSKGDTDTAEETAA